MALTVNAAFNKFLSDTVNLDPKVTKEARSSRNWLFDQVGRFQSDDTFPISHSEYNTSFGSFARRTKKRPLDDIDLMIGLHGQGAYYNEFSDRIEITANPETNLKAFCNDGLNTLNSI